MDYVKSGSVAGLAAAAIHLAAVVLGGVAPDAEAIATPTQVTQMATSDLILLLLLEALQVGHGICLLFLIYALYRCYEGYGRLVEIAAGLGGLGVGLVIVSAIAGSWTLLTSLTNQGADPEGYRFALGFTGEASRWAMVFTGMWYLATGVLEERYTYFSPWLGRWGIGAGTGTLIAALWSPLGIPAALLRMSWLVWQSLVAFSSSAGKSSSGVA